MLEIVRLTPDDATRFKALRLAALEESPDAFGSVLQDAIGRADAVWAEQVRGMPTFAAVSEGQDVGVARTSLVEPARAQLFSMWVHPAARGKGAGRALVRAVIEWSAAHGARQLTLEVEAGNQPAIALYRALGFVATGHTAPFPAPRQHLTEMQMRLELPA